MAHKISGGEVVLDLAELTRTAQIAVGLARGECERNLGAFQNASLTVGVNYNMVASAERLKSSAAQLDAAMQTLFALDATKTRDEVKLK